MKLMNPKRYTYPHKIDNGGGEEITFISFNESIAGGMLEIENRVQPGVGPPMHVHHWQDESLTVVQGKIGAQILGEPPTFHGVGETVTFKRGVAHKFWNAGEELLVCRGMASPAYNLEYFLTEIFHSTKANGGKIPSVLDAAFLQRTYQSEFDMVEMPAFVKKILLPLLFVVGKWMGTHRKFAGAPQPLTVS